MSDYPKMVFRKHEGTIQSQIIEGPPIPDGWSDDLKAVKAGEPAKKVTKKVGKKKAAKKKVRR